MGKHEFKIEREDFRLLPDKLSVARVFAAQLAIISQQQHRITREDIYNEIEKAHINFFNADMPFPNYDTFRKFYSKNLKKIYH